MNVYVFLAITFSIFFMLYPIKLKASISYNFIKNKGQINFMFFKFKVLNFKIRIKRKFIMLTTKRGKNILLPIDFQDQQSIEYVDIMSVLINKTTINSIEIQSNIGVENEPFLTAILYGIVQSVSSVFLAILKNKKLSIKIINNIKPEYYKDIGTIYIKMAITFSIFDYLWGFILFKFNLKKVGNRYEQTRQQRKKSNWSINGRSNEPT